MQIISTTNELASYLNTVKNNGNIGFVPTMGALHEGHLNLIRTSKQNDDTTICSVFVNKIQFTNEDDFIKYPRNIEQDIKLLEQVGCDCVFIPTQEVVFPIDYKYEIFNLGKIEHILEGLYRPGHFQGVCNVVNRFIELIQPNKLYLGIKDLQQCKVIEKMIHLKKYEPAVELIFCATSRNEKGLALSSRNKRLSNDAKNKALILIEMLKSAKEQILSKSSNLDTIKQFCITTILTNGFESVDYFEFADQHFELVNDSSTNQNPVYILTAATIEGVRLIDNIIIGYETNS